MISLLAMPVLKQPRGRRRQRRWLGWDFCIFWEKFHDITEHPKVNIGRARREWKKLTAGEKQRALDNIDEYYDHLNNQKYCKQAATYLADKSFENEYDD